MQNFTKNDDGKLLFHLIQPEFLHELAEVLTDGAKKYSPDNWKNCPAPYERYYSALQRHLNAYAQGEGQDQESGRSHLMHAACCILFLRHFERVAASQGGVRDTVSMAEPTMDHTGAPGSTPLAWEFLGASR